MVGGSVEELSVVQVAVVGGLWSTCRWVGGRLLVVAASVVGGLVENLSVGRLSVVGACRFLVVL